jgi:hypothetical protein
MVTQGIHITWLLWAFTSHGYSGHSHHMVTQGIHITWSLRAFTSHGHSGHSHHMVTQGIHITWLLWAFTSHGYSGHSRHMVTQGIHVTWSLRAFTSHGHSGHSHHMVLSDTDRFFLSSCLSTCEILISETCLLNAIGVCQDYLLQIHLLQKATCLPCLVRLPGLPLWLHRSCCILFYCLGRTVHFLPNTPIMYCVSHHSFGTLHCMTIGIFSVVFSGVWTRTWGIHSRFWEGPC